MRQIVGSVISVLSVVFLAASLMAAGGETAVAQAKSQAPAAAEQPALKQMALTDKQIENVLAATEAMDAITAKMPENAAPDAKLTAQLDAAARKSGFANYEEYSTVVDNIGIVLAGFDPATKKYVGPEAVIKAQIAQVEADKKMPARDKKEALGDLNDALKSPPPPIENKGNIDLVARYYDKLIAALGDDQE